MGAPKPTLGYPSRTACALALQAKGMHYKAIARQMGIKDSTVGALLSGAKRKRPSVENQRTVYIDVDVLDALRPAADRRGLSVNKLCRQLIGCIADDDITDAILDDALELPA